MKISENHPKSMNIFTEFKAIKETSKPNGLIYSNLKLFKLFVAAEIKAINLTAIMFIIIFCNKYNN